jgi:hypothetical protein
MRAAPPGDSCFALSEVNALKFRAPDGTLAEIVTRGACHEAKEKTA